MADPLTVPCPDCAVPVGATCATSVAALTGASHAERRRHADLRAVEHGYCSLCGQPMVRGTIDRAPLTAWHPDPTDATTCPHIPHPGVDPAGWTAAINSGLSPGHPGLDRFIHTPRDTSPIHEQTANTLARPLDTDALEDGRRIASQRDDLIAQGINPTLLGVPTAPHPAPLCPECRDGKHRNCDGSAWDMATDEPAECTCPDETHQ